MTHSKSVILLGLIILAISTAKPVDSKPAPKAPLAPPDQSGQAPNSETIEDKGEQTGINHPKPAESNISSSANDQTATNDTVIVATIVPGNNSVSVPGNGSTVKANQTQNGPSLMPQTQVVTTPHTPTTTPKASTRITTIAELTTQPITTVATTAEPLTTSHTTLKPAPATTRATTVSTTKPATATTTSKTKPTTHKIATTIPKSPIHTTTSKPATKPAAKPDTKPPALPKSSASPPEVKSTTQPPSGVNGLTGKAHELIKKLGLEKHEMAISIVVPMAVGICSALVIVLVVYVVRVCQRRNQRNHKQTVRTEDLGNMDRAMLLAESSEDEF